MLDQTSSADGVNLPENPLVHSLHVQVLDRYLAAIESSYEVEVAFNELLMQGAMKYLSKSHKDQLRHLLYFIQDIAKADYLLDNLPVDKES